MDRYVTGAAIRRLREGLGMTQAELAERLHVSDKAVSKWETGHGYPDITLLEPIAAALRVSVTELLSGEAISNKNTCGNMLRSKLHVCPVCGNILLAAGSAVISCCGITLPPPEAEEEDEEHVFCLERVEDETYVTLEHSMTKTHYISFIAWANGSGVHLEKLYPEGSAAARFKLRGHGILYCCCNRHGLFKKRL